MKLFSYLRATLDLIARRRQVAALYASLPKPSRLLSRELFDVAVFEDFPSQGMRYHVTRGLYAHTLRDECRDCEDEVLHELAIATFVDGPRMEAVQLLFDLGEEAVRIRRGFADKLVYEMDMTSYFPDGDACAGVLAAYNAWLPLEDRASRVDVVDLLPLEEEQVREYGRDRDAFLSRMASGLP